MPVLPRLHIFEKMRGLFTPVMQLRRQILKEVATMIVEEKPASYVEQIPYNIIKKPVPTFRDSVFAERAIVKERVRLAFGLDIQEFGAETPVLFDVTPAMNPHKHVEKPIVNVIKIACERCPEDSFFVSDSCRDCIAHPCTLVCPVDAIFINHETGRSEINQDKCIRCGKCAQVCPYNAIHHRERPCAAACGVGAIGSDEYGFANIDYEKCVSCGLCIVSCPFGAIGEKSEIVQVLYALKDKERPVVAEIAPSFVGQFGRDISPEQIIKAIKMLGFKEIKEVAYGADVAILDEAKQLADLILQDPKERNKKFIGTSCCPAWVQAARNNYPELAENISESSTPMVATAQKLKEIYPNCRVVFIGPCISKKNECFDPKVADLVDYIITYEELAALLEAKNINLREIPKDVEKEKIQDASQIARAFPVAGGVADAIIKQTCEVLKEISEKPISCDIPVAKADTLEECLLVLKKIKKTKNHTPYLLVEGMACPFGCIGGPGTLAPLNRAKKHVKKFAEQSSWELSSENLKK